MKRNWTEEEDNYILNNHNKMTWLDMSKFLSCSIATVQGRARKLGIEVENKELTRWTAEEVKLLREYADKYITKNIAKKLNKTVVAVKKKAEKEGIKLHSSNDPWKKWMIDYLKDNIETKSIRQISLFIGITEYQVKKKCEELNIEYDNKRWTKEEEEILISSCKSCHYSELTKLLPGKTAAAILCKSRQLNLDIITESNHYKYDRKTAKYIKENWGKISINEMARQLGIPRSKIYVYKKKLKLPNTGQNIKWNEQSISRLRELAKTKNISQLAKEFKTTNAAISTVASRNNIQLIDGKLIWDNEKIEKLKELAKDYSINELCTIFNTSYGAINRIINRCNIEVKDSYVITGWLDIEYNKLLELKESNEILDIPSIMKLVNKTDIVVINKCNELGIKYIPFPRKKWTNEEVISIIEDAKTLSINELVIKYNRSSLSIRSKLSKHDVKPMALVEHWTNEDIELLKQLVSEHKSIAYIANALNKSVAAIENKLAKEKIEIGKNKAWTEEEERYLIDMWDERNMRYIAKYLNRSISAIKNKAYELGLGGQFLHQDALKIEEIAEIFNVQRRDVETTWMILGLPYKVEKVSKNTSYKYVEIDDLFAFLENNQFLYDGKDFEENTLGMEPEWVKLKRKHDTFYGFEYDRTSLIKKKLLQQKKYYLELLSDENNDEKVLKKQL